MSRTITNSISTGTKLTDAQTAMLNTASRREDRCLPPISSLRGAQIVKTGEKLIAAGWVREVKAKGSIPVWRRDGAAGTAFALKLTAAGAKAIAPEGDAPSKKAAVTEVSEPPAPLATASAAPVAKTTQETVVLGSIERRKLGEPRPTSKIAAVVGLLSRCGGATLAELIAATGWLPHTIRAALTGLRKRGYVLTLDRSDQNRGSAYLITSKRTERAGAAMDSAAEAE